MKPSSWTEDCSRGVKEETVKYPDINAAIYAWWGDFQGFPLDRKRPELSKEREANINNSQYFVTAVASLRLLQAQHNRIFFKKELAFNIWYKSYVYVGCSTIPLQPQLFTIELWIYVKAAGALHVSLKLRIFNYF